MISYDDYCDAANPSPVSCSECKEDVENCECGEDPPEGDGCVRDDSTECDCPRCVAQEDRFWDEQGERESDLLRHIFSPAPERTNRQRTRALWRKRGRR